MIHDFSFISTRPGLYSVFPMVTHEKYSDFRRSALGTSYFVWFLAVLPLTVREKTVFVLITCIAKASIEMNLNMQFRESCFHHPLFDLRGTLKVENRHSNFHFSSKNVTSKNRKVKVYDLKFVKKFSTFRPHFCEIEVEIRKY